MQKTTKNPAAETIPARSCDESLLEDRKKPPEKGGTCKGRLQKKNLPPQTLEALA
jgi:hypothetical protein